MSETQDNTHRMLNGAEEELVGNSLQDDLYISLQKTALAEVLGLLCKRFWYLFVSLHLEHGALKQAERHNEHDSQSFFVETSDPKTSNIYDGIWDIKIKAYFTN